jgi:hypothetical protein
VFLLRLLSIVVKFAVVAAIVVGGVFVYENRDRVGSAIPGSSSATVDYNCGLPGPGFAWLEQARGSDPWHGDLDAPYHLGGIFRSTVPSHSDYAVALPVRIRDEGTPTSMADVYRMLCAVHPDLGGSGLRPMTPEEKRTLDLGDSSGAPDDWDAGQIPNLYTDGVDRAADEAHLGWERMRVYLLPPIPQGLRDALTTASRSVPVPSATPTPAASGETRRYRVTVNGYENGYYWHTGESVGVRFDYRLVGEFELQRPSSSKPWVVASRRVVAADLTYSSLYPPDRYEVTLDCTRRSRSCEGQLIRNTTLRLRVEVAGDEIIARWGAFRPEVLATGKRTDTPEVIDSSFISEFFDDAVAGERLPLQDLYVGPERVKTYQGRSVTRTSFTYGLERLP